MFLTCVFFNFYIYYHHMAQNKYIGIFFFVVFFSLTCQDPFFLDIIRPQEPGDLRKTPEGVVKLLRLAYTGKRIDDFEDVLYSEEEFRFYVEQNENIIDSLQKINPQQKELVVIDKELSDDFISPSFFYIYLTYNEEMNIHRNMFREAEHIDFETRLEECIYNIDYFDTLRVEGDSVYYDTTEAVVYIDENKILIASNKLDAIFGEQVEHEFPIGRQVFFMKKDNENLWSIYLWFERKIK